MRYVALMRGIGPRNPNMRNPRYREVFEELGFTRIDTIATTGNVVFDSTSRTARALEARIQAAWPEHLGFESTTIVRTRAEILALVASQPFSGIEDLPASRAQVTFLQHAPDAQRHATPPDGPGYSILSADDRHIAWTIDTTSSRTPDAMRALERAYGKDITTRTWRIVSGIARKLE